MHAGDAAAATIAAEHGDAARRPAHERPAGAPPGPATADASAQPRAKKWL